MAELPYRVAVLCYLFDEAGRLLLLHRHKRPNRDLYSPVGGKLEQARGESPTACALREIREETGLVLSGEDLHLTGIVSEAGYEDEGHWLIFLYEVTRPVALAAGRCAEGSLGWHRSEDLEGLAIPRTDREVIWPLFWRYRRRFFMAHIHCQNGGLSWEIEQPGQPESDRGGPMPPGGVEAG